MVSKGYVSPLALMFPRVIDMKILIAYTSLLFSLNGPTRFPLPPFLHHSLPFFRRLDALSLSLSLRPAMEIDLRKNRLFRTANVFFVKKNCLAEKDAVFVQDSAGPRDIYSKLPYKTGSHAGCLRNCAFPRCDTPG